MDPGYNATQAIHCMEVLSDKLRTIRVNYTEYRKFVADHDDPKSRVLAVMMLDVLMESIPEELWSAH
jgi:hypothetical protein